METLVKKLIEQKNLNAHIIARFKRQWAKKHQHFPKNSEIIKVYKKLVKEKKIKPNRKLEIALRLKKVRSLSGIVPVAVMTKPYPCPGQCIYCPTQDKMPKSYLDDEPAVMRAVLANFDPFLQVQRRLKQLQETGHSTEKIELIVMGGTFSVLPRTYQINFIGQCFLAANGMKKITPQKLTHLGGLDFVQKANETAKNRIIGLTLETRPDEIDEKEIKWMRKLGCTRVEIGVQSTDDRVLKLVKRGHTVKQTIKATKLLKDAGFKVCYHLMPNLPGSNPQKDLKMFKEIFTNPDFMPDMIKIYPCVVTYQAKLYDWFKKGKFKSYTDKQLISLLLKIKQIVPEWVRINRLGRDIPISNIAAGNKLSNIRQVVHREMRQKGIKCQCIRCREVKQKKYSPHYSLLITHYSASNGKEYFFQYKDSKNRLYALLRLRITSQKTAIIRELHTFGESLPIKNNLAIWQFNNLAVQHTGLGKKLISKAEQISKSGGMKKISVIAGVGVREYYRKLGYKLQDTYMVKSL